MKKGGIQSSKSKQSFYRMKKRGISGIIVTMVMVTLVLVLLGVVWVVISNLLTEQVDRIDGSHITTNLNIKSAYVEQDNETAYLSVYRGIGDGEISALKFTFSSSGGSYDYLYPITEGIPDEGETKIYNITADNVGIQNSAFNDFSDIISISVAFQYPVKSGTTKTSGIKDTYSSTLSSSSNSGLADRVNTDVYNGTGDWEGDEEEPEEPEICELTNAYWSETEVNNGTTVTMIVEGNNCDSSDLVNFTVWEDELGLGNILTATMIDNFDRDTWTAIIETEDDFFFNAFLVSNPGHVEKSNNLDVTFAIVPPTCDDGTQNQGETDVDCGGSNCGACSNGESCSVDGDCTSNNCDDGTCEAVVEVCNNDGNCDAGETNANCPNDCPVTEGAIIIDHTAVDLFDAGIPQAYIDEVKKMWMLFPGASHSAAYRDGLTLLEAQDSTYAVNAIETTPPEAYREDALRSNKVFYGSYGWTSNSAGEDDWYTNTLTTMENTLDQIGNTYGQTVLGFGWCWDMGWHNLAGGTVDPVYNVRWAGASEGGPEGDLRWGLDANDESLTGNSVCMDTYLDATQHYSDYAENQGYDVTVVFTTGPVDNGGYNADEEGYQRYLKHEHMRNYVTNSYDEILFDYADILTHDDDGSQNIISWDGHNYPFITDLNDAEDTGHISNAGAIRLAKAQWVLGAILAGWDGTSESPVCIDGDNDGYGNPASIVCTYNSLDCEDGDILINPGATEVCGDGLDNDCVGGDASCGTCTDSDNDGYGNPASEDCTYSSLDCDDGDILINPGATEVCGDGLDNDCVGGDASCGGTNFLNDPNLVSVYEFADAGNLGFDTRGVNTMDYTNDQTGTPLQSSIVPSGFSGYSVAMDGEDALCVLSGTFDQTSDHTLCWWARPTSIGTNNHFSLASNYDTDNEGTTYTWSTRHSSGDFFYVDVPNAHVIDTWTHICNTYDASENNKSVFVEGIIANSAIQEIASKTGYWGIGAYCTETITGRRYVGNIFQPMWFDRVLTAQEINNLHTNNYFE
jgi:hypothetical protein